MSLDAARFTKLLKTNYADELHLRFFFSSNDAGAYLWAEKWGVKACVEVDDKFLEAQHVDYREGKIRELYAAWFEAGCRTLSDADEEKAPVVVKDGYEVDADEPDVPDEEVPAGAPLTESAKLESYTVPPPGDMSLPDIANMTVSQVAEALEGMAGEDLLRLLSTERAGKDRKGVVAAIEKKLDEVMG